MLGLRLGQMFKNVPAHHGVDLKRLNPAKAARAAAADPHADDADRWTPPVLATVAAKGEGVDELAAALDRHFEYLERTGALRTRRRQRLRERVISAAERHLQARLWGDQEAAAWLDAQLDGLEAGQTTPFTVADELLSRSAARLATSRTERSPQ